MSGGGGSAPDPDPNIGKAAMLSAKTGEQMLAWMQDQAKVTNQWATEDRGRYTSVFQPLQDRYIAEADSWASPERMGARADEAAADVALAARQGQEQMARQMASMGVNPASGRFAGMARSAALQTGLATAGARNNARRQVQAEGDARMAGAINLGQGLGVNPGQSMQISNQAGGAGFSGAMQGYGQQASLLNQDYQNRLDAWKTNQQSLGSAMGALGTVMGALPWTSSKEVKTDKAPVKGALDAAKRMPVEAWTYKPGAGDGGRHVGPYAEDFKAATGVGDGKTIDPISLVGVTLGAVQELSAKVDALEAKRVRA